MIQPQFGQPANQNGYSGGQQPAAPAVGNPGASLIAAMAQGGGGQQFGMQPQFNPQPQPQPQPQFAPQFNAPQLGIPQFVSQSNALQVPPQQQSGGFIPPQLQMPSQIPMAQQPTQQFIQPNAPQQFAPQQPYPGIVNPMSMQVPQQQFTQQPQPQYAPPLPVTPTQQPYVQPYVQPAPQYAPQLPQQFTGQQFYQQPGAGPPLGVGPMPLAGVRPPQAPPVGGMVPQQQFAPQQFAAPQQPPFNLQQAPAQRDYEMQRLQNDLAVLNQQLRTSQQSASGQQPQQGQQVGVPQQPVQTPHPAPVVPRFDFDNWPDANIMFGEWRETQRLPDGRTATDWKPNTPVNVRIAGDQYLQHLASWENGLLYEPHKVLPELIERHATKIAEKIVNDRVSASENSTRVDMLLSANEWLFATDPASGQMTLNDYGRKMVSLAQYQPGKPLVAGDVHNIEVALQQVKLERERDDLRRQLQTAQYGGMQYPGQFAPQQLSPQGLPPGVQPMLSPVGQQPWMQPQQFAQQPPQYVYPGAPQQPQLSPDANQQINQRLTQLDRMTQNVPNRNGSMPNQAWGVPSTAPQQNQRLSAGEKLINGLRFGTAPAY